ncbi:chromate transporter [Afipia carboxidovorans OM5]|uniref:Putative chromate transport protein n=1 Tax=Afipia carboxidovorans (strain ATCC 49405 / DSM 1227 / KCTC 32145 / OM5) TaxID=504832 RepID=B6JAB1_AFIC5|nr:MULTISPECIES: chromate efflux transporter [Hyphomicrobiales]ACI91377.1 chromate transporter [Afipia carboxidovorans OM5]AEI01442.1 putative chromate transport protein [Afipia carboxidovorans OM4]AEI05017.1 putative chromate transport protein [Afipia carboxidovorans OM5]
MDQSPQQPKASAAEVFRVFLKLGLTSFGGPIAHLGYFRDELVTRRKWLSESAYADLVALCQFLPGPASSQVGFALGLTRAGWLGAFAAFLAFTLPSALILLALAMTATRLESPLALGVLHGLKIVAVAIVAQAVWGMARNLCPDKERATIAVAAVLLLAWAPGAIGMMGAILLGAIAGLVLSKGQVTTGAHLPVPVSRKAGLTAFALFAVLLIGLPLLAAQAQGWALADSFYRAGSLVFGGGHVVLPLLQAETVTPGWVSDDAFLAGYGAAQAVPGPLFTFAAWLGAVMGPAPNGVAGAAIALVSLFLPGFLILIGALPFWDRLRRTTWAQSAMQGANAAVVGILGAALYSPVFTSAIGGMPDFALALVCFVALMAWKAPPWVVVLLAAGGGAALDSVM